MRWLYGEAGRAGMAQLVVWGGEPLVRQDLPELLLAARRAGLFTTLITNGWFVGQRWRELRGLVDALVQFSLDDVGSAHDALRGLSGLYEQQMVVFFSLLLDSWCLLLFVQTRETAEGIVRGPDFVEAENSASTGRATRATAGPRTSRS